MAWESWGIVDARADVRQGAERSGGLEVAVRLRRGAEGARFTLDVKLEAPPGVTVVFGPSGGGKSTLLSIVAGLVRPDAGTVRLGTDTWFDGDSAVEVPVHRRRVAFVFQGLALFPHMTAAQNVAYGVDRALGAGERADRAHASLTRFRADHLADRHPATFSGGEAQRVALARAFAMSPAVVLLDEPFSAMDRGLRGELVQLVRRLADDLAVPVLHVTHRRSEALALGDRVAVIRAGRVESLGPPRDVLGGDR
jgi:molybdate transport system ATP-binding protein